MLHNIASRKCRNVEYGNFMGKKSEAFVGLWERGSESGVTICYYYSNALDILFASKVFYSILFPQKKLFYEKEELKNSYPFGPFTDLVDLDSWVKIIMEKVYITPHLWGWTTYTPNLWNGIYHPLNFSKPVKLPPKQFWKIIVNHKKIIKWKILLC